MSGRSYTAPAPIGVDHWQVSVKGHDSAALADMLTMTYRGEHTGPADGFYGGSILDDRARKTGGVMEWLRPPTRHIPGEPQPIY